MSKRNLIVTAIVAVLTLAAVPLVYAQHEHGSHGGMHDGAFAGLGFGHLQRAKEYLDLTDAQVDQLKAIGADLRQQNAPYRKQIHGGLLQIAQTLVNNPNDTTAAQAIINQQTAAENAMKTNALNAASKALNVLTPDQRTKVADFIAKRAARHQEQ